MLQRLLSLAQKEILHLRNDWMLPAFMLLGGALELLLVGWATSRPIENLPLLVIDQDHSPTSRQLVTDMLNSGTFSLFDVTTDFTKLGPSMQRGQVNAAIVIPNGFESKIIGGKEQAILPVILNGAESTPARAALRTIEGFVRRRGDQIALQRLGMDPENLNGLTPSLRVWFNESLSEALYTTPAELGLMLEFTVLLFAALAFSRERELGTLEQLLVMPFSSLEIIFGKALPVVLIGLTDFGLMLGMVHYAFGVPVRGSLPLLWILALGYVIVELSKGLVISVMVRTQHQAFLSVMMIGMIDFMFTGYAAPVESMPWILQQVAKLVPAHHWLSILRGIMLKGAGLEELWPHILALAGLGFVIVTFSLRFVRRALS